MTEGTKPPGVERIPQGDKPRGVAAEGDGVPGGDKPNQASANAGPDYGSSRDYSIPGLVAPPGRQAIWAAEESSDGAQPNI